MMTYIRCLRWPACAPSENAFRGDAPHAVRSEQLGLNEVHDSLDVDESVTVAARCDAQLLVHSPKSRIEVDTLVLGAPVVADAPILPPAARTTPQWFPPGWRERVTRTCKTSPCAVELPEADTYVRCELPQRPSEMLTHRDRHFNSSLAKTSVCGTHRTWVGRFERRKVNIGLDNLETMSQKLGVTLSVLFTEAEHGRD